MSTILRMRVEWQGPPVVGPGVSTHYFEDGGTGIPPKVLALYTALKNYVPTGVIWTIPTQLDVITVETGVLAGAVTQAGGGTVASSGGAVDYKPGVGGRIRWSTGGIIRGRRVTGTTFVVPLTSQEYPSGVVQGGTVTAINTALTAFLTAGGYVPCIYSKPKAPPGGIGPDSPGVRHLVTGATMSSKETWLRSRRV